MPPFSPVHIARKFCGAATLRVEHKLTRPFVGSEVAGASAFGRSRCQSRRAAGRPVTPLLPQTQHCRSASPSPPPRRREDGATVHKHASPKPRFEGRLTRWPCPYPALAVCRHSACHTAVDPVDARLIGACSPQALACAVLPAASTTVAREPWHGHTDASTGGTRTHRSFYRLCRLLPRSKASTRPRLQQGRFPPCSTVALVDYLTTAGGYGGGGGCGETAIKCSCRQFPLVVDPRCGRLHAEAWAL